ncbi:hypothetical protein L873DRAFT_558034 [Choiromyces venosus 120613-1]|uniref:Uncharacterized protein n=1 Tax=Choiromyces venosus 120613-1 TaxID=1336337 RepID=A0A3N4K5P0_9PEZI|nr:hypothetical protein L873DRAFT_558034 [Choiromyces venosus 120613-1]
MHKKLKSLRITTFRFLSLLLPPYFATTILKQPLIVEKKEKTVHPLSLATVLRY